MKATREKQERFIRSFGNGHDEIKKCAETLIAWYGSSWLTDAQMLEITSHKVACERSRIHRNIRNRRSA